MVRIVLALVALVVTTGGDLAQDDVALGKQIFADRCASCHSGGGNGAKNAPIPAQPD